MSGGAGVIGHEIVPRLIDRGARVFVGDLKPRPHQFDESVQYRQGDLNTLTGDELEAFAPEVFIHLAATFERSTESYGFWDDNFWHNVRLSHHLMTLCKDLNSLSRVVFASSYLIYDPSLYQFDAPKEDAVRLSEGDPISPRNLTGMAKLSHEMELRFLGECSESRLSSVAARIFRGYGCNSRCVISRWIRMALEGEPIEVYRPEGAFDYIYASDSAEGLIRLAENPECQGVVNLGSGRARRVADVVAILQSHFPGLEVRCASSDIPFEASCANNKLLNTVTGWTPRKDLEDAIPEMIAYESSMREDSGEHVPGNVLICSASAKTALIQAMKKAALKLHPDIQVVAGDRDPVAISRYVAADEFWEMPSTSDESVDALLDGCKNRNVTLIYPTRDGELEFWAKHADSFRRVGIDVAISPLESVVQCVDKLRFAEVGASLGAPVIRASEHVDDIISDRFVVKERFGAGSLDIGIDLDRDAAIAHAAKLDSPIFQAFVDGREISVDAWLDRCGHLKGLVMRRRDVVVHGESRITTTFRDKALEKIFGDVLEQLDLRGPVVMQAILDMDGGPHIVECNARFGGASTASIAAGLDSLYWSLLESRGEDVSAYPFHRVPEEIRQVRSATDTIMKEF